MKLFCWENKAFEISTNNIKLTNNKSATIYNVYEALTCSSISTQLSCRCSTVQTIKLKAQAPRTFLMSNWKSSLMDLTEKKLNQLDS
ncbi:CLUMA_CG008392, isoform A [Clunio marinus]|uniref:CLUMA_CG008392, isoform A n=1 Tax=Clunio marinus TaxID=568069 RepID=A0A1J1I5P1_9DIPT|nr:CLUMA_CG008392, isoform A [Clunio marinus]